jgi:hypothetical protein
MSSQEPVIPDPDAPSTPGGPVQDPQTPDTPAEYSTADSEGLSEWAAIRAEEERSDDGLDPYDAAVADSFPASDPPAASEPGSP